MKQDLTCYEYKRDLIAELDPAPQYPVPAMMSQARKNRAMNSRYNLERIRSSHVTRNRNELRFGHGRTHAHFKLEQLKSDVSEIKAQESVQQAELVAAQRGIEAPDVQIDDQFLLPYGAGYDHIIKAKAELIDSQKQANNLVMDQLVWKLGYMDYRDALACNKYIVETKLSGDYEQIARGQILQSALARLSTKKREEIKKNAT
jgi:hypothetical protein